MGQAASNKHGRDTPHGLVAIEGEAPQELDLGWYTRREKLVVPPAANNPFLTLFYSALQKLTTKIESCITS